MDNIPHDICPYCEKHLSGTTVPYGGKRMHEECAEQFHEELLELDRKLDVPADEPWEVAN